MSDRECNDPGKACGADHHCNDHGVDDYGREAEEGSDADSRHSVDSGVVDSSGLTLSQLDEDNIDNNRPEQVAPGKLPPSPGGSVNHHLQHFDSHNLNASKIDKPCHQQDQNQGASLELNTEGASRTPDLMPRGECSSCLGYNHGHCFKCHNVDDIDQYCSYSARNTESNTESVAQTVTPGFTLGNDNFCLGVCNPRQYRRDRSRDCYQRYPRDIDSTDQQHDSRWLPEGYSDACTVTLHSDNPNKAECNYNSARVDPQGLACSADDNFRKQLDGKRKIIYTPPPPESDTGHVAHTVLQTYIPGDTCGETLENATLLQNQSPGSSDVVFDKPETLSTPDPRDYFHEPVPNSESSGNIESIPTTSTSDYESNRGDQSSEAPKRKRKPNKSLRKVARNIISRFSGKTRKVPKKKKVPTATLR